MEILENSEPQITVGSFTVTDADAEASISFDIQKEECTGGSSSMDVSGWFEVLPDPPSQTNFPARVVVGDVEIDREACKEVTLTIKATDDKTDEKYESESSATESFVITILDEIDESPIVDCKYGCGVISIDEVNEIDPSSYASVLVTTLTVTDPDEEDTIYLSLREGDEFVYLSKENVSVQAGSVAEIDIFTKKDANINCEAQQTIPIEIFMEDSENHNATIKINVTVNDLNDNRPEIAAGLCGGEPLLIKEDDGSGEINGNPIGMITATDKDEESPHNHVRYMMLNDQYSDSKNTWTPFSIDEETGNVTILLINGVKALDREQYADWELFFRAYDECDNSPTCKVLQSEPDCLVKITVVDVNDNYPRDLTWLPDGPITVNDFLQQDQDIGYVFTALDDDEGENANLTYFVKGTYRLNSDQDMDLFRAEEDPFSIKPSCRNYKTPDWRLQNAEHQTLLSLLIWAEGTWCPSTHQKLNLSTYQLHAVFKTPIPYSSITLSCHILH
ncbi:protocadherin Fat 4-like [Eriocheir sinensis]|uniref:protocadherin Fat 4-like n=1 Tax=Eriocheir sinensis TaxID=95602 RepID=UPI0021C9AD6D|nr:protocadherin Fat 4-like [Eriocheir sinensis]